ncbi:MAG TPA: hypothetical protein VNC59_09715 [Thermoanaerobaculia bacterium]|nr:hypothetical protein [Thermoanaerobaculia bacterium]
MKSSAWAPALAFATGLACSHPAPHAPPGPPAEERVTLRAGESAAIRGTPARITFERILSDSRCAVDVVCIQAGEATASFRLDAGRAGADTFVLDTSRNGSAVVSGYRVSLVSVSPAPRSTVRIEPRSYVVVLSISQDRGNTPPS